MDKAGVFIDGAYLGKLLQEFGEPKIDFEIFSNELCEIVDAEHYRTYYYNCLPYQSSPPTDEEKRRYSAMSGFINNYLGKLPRFEVRLGKLSRFDIVCPKCSSFLRCDSCNVNRIKNYEQKRVDNLLTVDLTRLSWTRAIQKAILVTGDSDFVPVVDEAKHAGVSTIVFFCRKGTTTIHDELYNACDDRFEMDEDLIRKVTKV